LRRPGVVWFGEMLPEKTLAQAEEAARACGVMLVVGTAGVVYPAAGLVHTARAAGAKVIIVNPEETELDEVANVVLRGAAAKLVPELLGPARRDTPSPS
ncbi:MAG: Sir2 family NAD-dependent protein deacetylase, partial [Burkholderiaceae bacterium]